MRYDYIKRLVEGTRQSTDAQMIKNHTEMRADYPECISAEHIDANLLCDVIEEDLIKPLEHANIQEIINAIDRMQRGKPYGSDKNTLKGAITMLELLKESTRGKVNGN